MIFALFSMLILASCVQISASAAANPLKNMPKRAESIVSAPMGTGCDFFTPAYDSDFEMIATSSNKKVATVKVYSFSYGGKYTKGYMIIRKGYGTTNIKVTVKLGGKTYKKTCKYTFYKYSNPFTSFKIGKTNYTKRLNTYELTVPQSKLKGKVSIKIKKGIKIKRIFCWRKSGVYRKDIKNNSKLPSKTYQLCIEMLDTKRNKIFNVRISGNK